MKTIYIFILAVVCSDFFYAQTFTHQCAVLPVSKDSLYKIPLNPDINQYMNSDFRDLRIYDSRQKETPYVVLSEPLLKAKSDFSPYEILSQTHFKTFSEIVIANPNQKKINNIAFNINNSDGYKYCSIEGSDDNKQWYNISGFQELSLAYNEVYNNQYKCIYFPLSSYKYFKLSVDDWQTNPLKINSAGCFKNSVIAGKLNEVLHSQQITQDAKLKKTKVHLVFKSNQTINQIAFKIKAPHLFMRHCIIYAKRNEIQKRKTIQYNETIYEFDLASNEALIFDLPQINEQELFIEIYNKDNQPLEIESIKCLQLASYLICDLKANENYTLMFGNKSLKLPDYDLANFVTQIPQILTNVKLGIINEVPKMLVASNQLQKSFYEKPFFLWLCLGLGGLAIFFFSRSLLKDMSKKDE